jgi:hypothetical protein
VTVYATFGPDPVWVLSFVGAVALLIAGKWGSSRLGPAVSRSLVVAGALLLGGLIAYSLLMTWFAGPTK